ncbi:MAG: Swt1 family HEPN domain-containing protein [Anaerolineales bacterium]
MRRRLYDFTFRGLLASHAISDMQAKGFLRVPSGPAEETRDQDLLAAVPEVIRGSSLLMQRYYRLLYVFENLVRDFIITRLSEVDGEDWFENRTSAPMKKKVEDRKADESKNSWHIGRNDHPIYYLDFGDLGLLIQNNWAEFSDFLESQTWVLSRIQEAERTRNVIAHTNLLASEEGERLELYLRDWILQIG